jgi:hypothetical protein
MLNKLRRSLVRIHKDESAPNTVEWVLLIVVGLLVLIGIFVVARYAMSKADTAKQDADTGANNVGSIN